MRTFIYIVYAVILAAISIFTGEIVAFVLLGLILIALENIHRTLKEMLKVQKELAAKGKSDEI